MKEIWRVIPCREMAAAQDGDFIFYTDGTYRCSFWSTDDPDSEWRFENGHFTVRHWNMGDQWQVCNSSWHEKFNDILALELAIDAALNDEPETKKPTDGGSP